MYLGRRFRPRGNDNRIFNSGGAAYVLNQAAVSLLAQHLDDKECEAHRVCSWEDVQVFHHGPVRSNEAHNVRHN